MSWGYWVVIVLIVFFIGLGTMVYIASQQNNDMLDDNYYEKEMVYQDVIDAKNNLTSLNDSVQVSVQDSLVRIRIPLQASKNVTNGNIQFLRPADKTKDTTVLLVPNTDGLQWMARTAFIKGLYHIRAKWVSNGVNYFDERNIIIP